MSSIEMKEPLKPIWWFVCLALSQFMY